MDNSNLQLRHSELIYLLWLMKTLPLPGLDSKPIEDISGELTMDSLAAAELSLQERGLIAIQEAGTRIDQHVLILVGNCAMAKATLMVECQNKEGIAQNLSFHYYARSWVRHVLLEMGIHSFDLIDSPLGDCTELIGDPQSPLNSIPSGEFTLPKSVLDKVFTLFSLNQLEGLPAMLKLSGLPVNTTTALIDVLGEMQQKIIIGVTYHHHRANIAGEKVILIRNPQGLLRLDSLMDTEKIKLVPVTQRGVVETLNRIVHQAQLS